MSTATFSAHNTWPVIRTVLNYLFPWASQRTLDITHLFLRKFAHFVEYFVLGMLLLRAAGEGADGRIRLKWVAFAVVIVVLYAAGDELHQSFVASRRASVSDVCIDAAGGIFAQFTMIYRSRLRIVGDE